MNNNKSFLLKVLLFLIAFFISTSIVYQFTPTIQVHAENYHSGEGEGGGRPTKVVVGGPSPNKTCIGIYIAEKGDGEATSKVILISDDTHALNREQGAYKIDSKNGVFNTPLATEYFYLAPNMPHPVKAVGGEWVPNGNEVANWLMDKSPRGLSRWEELAIQFWSTEQVGDTTVYNKLMENPEDYVLIVVPIAWMNAYVGGVNTGKEYIATADGWAKFYDEKNQEKGDSLTARMTHKDLPFSMTVHGTWFECQLRGHDGEQARKLTNHEILNEGYGMHIIELDASASTECSMIK